MKDVGRWGLLNSMIFSLPITKTSDKIYACNLACRLELAFSLLILLKRLGKSHVPTIFSRKSIFAYCSWISSIFSKFCGRAHIMTSL